MKRLFMRLNASGISLIELSLVLLVISLAMVPVIRMVSGPESVTGEGSIDRLTGIKSREAIVGNAMVEKVLAGDFSAFECNTAGNPVAFNPATGLPTAGNRKTYNTCKSQDYNTPFYYQWSVLNTNSPAVIGQALPEQNEYYHASLKILDKPGGNTLLTLPTYFFRNTGSFGGGDLKIGIMFALDTSGSMDRTGGSGGIPPAMSSKSDLYDSVSNVAIPFLYHRYDAAKMASLSPKPGQVLNMWDNSQLDLVFGKQIGTTSGSIPPDPDPQTPNNEAYLYPGRNTDLNPSIPGLLGMGDCTSTSELSNDTPKVLRNVFIPYGRGDSEARNVIVALCEEKSSLSNWSSKVNDNLSRIEAARSASLALLLNLESNPAVTRQLELGFIPWSDAPRTTYQVSMEAPQVIPGVSGIHFKTMRERLLWINRADPSNLSSSILPITNDNGTQIHDGLDYARQRLLAKNYDKRIIVLLTDGDPSPDSGTNSNGSFGTGGLRDYAKNVLGNSAPASQRITLFSVGLIEADASLMTDMSNSTPDGQAFIANDIASLTPIFEAISYQIQKFTLLQISDRYGVTF